MLNATVGWWWADPVAAIVIAGLVAKEGLEAWRGGSCDDDDDDCELGAQRYVPGLGPALRHQRMLEAVAGTGTLPA